MPPKQAGLLDRSAAVGCVCYCLPPVKALHPITSPALPRHCPRAVSIAGGRGTRTVPIAARCAHSNRHATHAFVSTPGAHVVGAGEPCLLLTGKLRVGRPTQLHPVGMCTGLPPDSLAVHVCVAAVSRHDCGQIALTVVGGIVLQPVQHSSSSQQSAGDLCTFKQPPTRSGPAMRAEYVCCCGSTKLPHSHFCRGPCSCTPLTWSVDTAPHHSGGQPHAPRTQDGRLAGRPTWARPVAAMPCCDGAGTAAGPCDTRHSRRVVRAHCVCVRQRTNEMRCWRCQRGGGHTWCCSLYNCLHAAAAAAVGGLPAHLVRTCQWMLPTSLPHRQQTHQGHSRNCRLCQQKQEHRAGVSSCPPLEPVTARMPGHEQRGGSAALSAVITSSRAQPPTVHHSLAVQLPPASVSVQLAGHLPLMMRPGGSPAHPPARQRPVMLLMSHPLLAQPMLGLPDSVPVHLPLQRLPTFTPLTQADQSTPWMAGGSPEQPANSSSSSSRWLAKCIAGTQHL